METISNKDIQLNLKLIQEKLCVTNTLDELDIKFLLYVNFVVLLKENKDKLIKSLLISVLSVIDDSTIFKSGSLLDNKKSEFNSLSATQILKKVSIPAIQDILKEEV